MVIHQRRQKPEPWVIYRATHKATWSRPFYALDWLLAWLAHLLSRWVLIEVLEYLGTFSILIALIFYFAESGDRLKQKHYQAWQVINTAQGKGGSGGRIEALEELNADKVPLVGVDLTDAFLYGVKLNHAELLRSTFGSADLRAGSFESANLAYTNFDSANLRGVNLRRANLAHANFDNADLVDADLSGADITEAHFDSADLRNATVKGLNWKSVRSARLANLFGAKDAPADFMEWAKRNGALFRAE
jgi:uncharacterized protein YjbI with pentapeptide repeats